MLKVMEQKKQRAAQAAEARKLVEQAIAENRDNTPEELAKLEPFSKENAEAFERRMATLERVEAFESRAGESAGRTSDPGGMSDGPELDGPRHKYSLLRAYRCMMGLEKGGLEAEVSSELAVRSGKKPQTLLIPWNLATHREEMHAAGYESRALGPIERRAVSTTTGAGSIANILGTQLIDLLRNRMVVNQMGASVLNDMTGGTFSLPKQTAASTFYWVAEGNAPSTSNLTLGQVTWTPKTGGAVTDLTRKFILQTNQDAEALARMDLAKQVAIGLDYAALNGSGQGQNPLGILQDPNVPIVDIGTNGGAPTWATVVNLEKKVAQANAEFGRLGYVTSNAGRASMKQTPKIASTAYPIYLWENDALGTGIVNGYRAMSTEQVPSNLTKGSGSSLTALIYGNWESATYAFWSGLDFMIDPYTGSSSGTIRFIALQDLDLQYRYEQSFAKTLDINPN